MDAILARERLPVQRDITPSILKSLPRKIVLLSGPRQVGKTTLARSLNAKCSYLNFDSAEHRLLLRRKEWPRDTPLLILDELHKMRSWKSWLKGIYDTEGLKPPILVTGSARLDIARRMGDSLAGRFFQFRLHPLSMKELFADDPHLDVDRSLAKLMTFGGFPEPYLADDPVFLGQWQASHLDVILRQDLLDLENVRDIKSIESLIELLSHRVGQLVSFESLARDLERSATTVKRWLTLLETMYVAFSLTPYATSIARSLRQARKYYLFDAARVKNGDGARFENIVALALRKECDRLADCEGQRASLHFLRTKDGREVDFLLKIGESFALIETKWSDDQFAPDLKHFASFFPRERLRGFQVVASLKQEREVFQGPKMVKAAGWLAALPLTEGEGQQVR
jgi:hypothetical protein